MGWLSLRRRPPHREPAARAQSPRNALVFLYPTSERTADGIRDYTLRLVEQLESDGIAATIARPPTGVGLLRSLLPELRSAEPTLIVQYNPFSWGRWGIAPNLLISLAIIRASRRSVRIILMVHEAYMPLRGFSWIIMGLWQRAQAHMLLALSHRVAASTAAITFELSRGRRRHPVRHLPVGSNLPDERGARHATRSASGYADHFVIATFSSGHVSHLHNLVTCAAEEVARASSRPVALLLLGSKNGLVGNASSVDRVITPGYLDARSVAQALAAADLFLGPFEDGAQTRRGSLMAAMQQAVAIVTTLGSRTDAVLATSKAFMFAAPRDEASFAGAAVELALNDELRERHAAACRELYDRFFAWPVVATGLLEVIDDSRR